MPSVFALVALSMLPAATAQVVPEDPFRVEARDLSLAPQATGCATVILAVPAGHHLYQDMITVTVSGSGPLAVGSPSLPPAQQAPDPAAPGQTRGMYDSDVWIELPLTAPAAPGAHDLTVDVGYQGCKAGLCWMPGSQTVTSRVTVAPGAAPTPCTPDGGAAAAPPAPSSPAPTSPADASREPAEPPDAPPQAQPLNPPPSGGCVGSLFLLPLYGAGGLRARRRGGPLRSADAGASGSRPS